jgi:hypothetical protein
MRLLTQNASSPLILTSYVKNMFSIVKGCKNKDYPDGNALNSWEELKNKYEPVSAPSMIKLDKQFRYSSLKKYQDPEVWITKLEDYCVRLHDMSSRFSENQLIIHVLNDHPSEYDLQLDQLEKKIGDKKAI